MSAINNHINQIPYKESSLKDDIKNNVIRGFFSTILLIILLSISLIILSKVKINGTTGNNSTRDSTFSPTGWIETIKIKIIGENNPNSGKKEYIQSRTSDVANYKASDDTTIIDKKDDEIKDLLNNINIAGMDLGGGYGFGNSGGNGSGFGTSNSNSGTKTGKILEDEFPGSEDISDVDIYPDINLKELQKRVVYPRIAIEARVEGKVIIGVLVDRTGKPIKTKITYSESNLLDKAAEVAVMNSVFTPARFNNKAVDCWLNIPVDFKLR